MDFSKSELKEVFDRAYYQRGRAYFNQRMVIELQSVSESTKKVVFEAKVQGSGIRVYHQKITIKKDAYSNLDINGYCSCPMDYNCKHVVAACLKYQGEHCFGVVPTADSLEWLSKFASSFDGSDQALHPDGEFLLYLFQKGKYSQAIKVSFHRTQILKNGSLAKGKTVSFESFAGALYTKPKYMQTSDYEIAKLLQVDNDSYGYTAYIKGSIGFMAMQQMLTTDRCYWNQYQAGKSLKQGEARACMQQWVYDDTGNAQFQLQVQPQAILLPTDPVLFLDTLANEVGVLNNMPYNTSQLQMLMNAPSVPVDLLDEFSQRAALSIPKTILPPPKAIKIEDIVNQPPIPYLRLHVKPLGNHDCRLGRLRFTYAGHELSVLPEDEQRSLMQDNVVLNIHRNIAEEQRFMDELQAIGFEGGLTEGSEDLYFLFNSENQLEHDALWSDFISHHIPELQEQGWRIEIDGDFDMQFHDVETWQADIEEQTNDWFNLRFDVEINGQKQALLPLIAQVLEYYEPDALPDTLTLSLGHGQYLNLPREQIKPVLDILYELYDHDSLSDDGALKMSRFDAGRLADLEQGNTNLKWRGGDNLRQIGKQLKDFEGIQVMDPPLGLNAKLRHYQQQGLNWLQFLRRYQFNGILADDMGLGKTVQTLAHLLLEKEQGRMDKPCLIVAPTSLMSNWRREAAMFTPALKVLTLQGAERHQHFTSINDYDLVLSTYPLLVRDEDVLLAHEFHMVILDEAQVVKNPKAKAAKVVRQLNTHHRLCLTGTPMENHLGELWALFDFLMPGFLGDMKQFNNLFRTPIEKHGNAEQQQRLVQRVTPFMLRRIKDDVLAELPAKTEIIRTVTLGKKQAVLYESIRISMEKKVRDTIENKGLARSHITILDALLKLRQVCCDPRILSLKQASKLNESAKLELLMQMLPEMLEEGRRILLFSQFTKMLSLIEEELKSHKISYSKLTGQTRKRDEVIEKFKRGDADVFLISLKAGGVGLNLTEADTVIHYDPWWNPAAENQATDRAHRIGQDKAVFVYKLVVENSVEEKIIAMQAKKKALADAVYQQGKKKDELQISADDMKALFEPLT